MQRKRINKMKMKKRESDRPKDKSAFLIGRTVYLRPPNIEKDVLYGDWFTWFNDKDTTRFLGQGIWPNTIEKQLAYVESLRNDPTKVLLCIIDRETDKHIGVVSFSDIDLFNRKANISIVLGEKDRPNEASIEAMALMTEYGFDRSNLLKINAGQSEGLWKWVNVLELLGYRIEGYIESFMVRDGVVQNGVHTGITAERFYGLRRERGGSIMPESIKAFLKRRRKENVVEKVKEVLLALYQS